MIDQYAVLWVVLGAFFLGLVTPSFWRHFFGGASYEEAKSKIYDFVIAMDEKYPDLAGPEKKRRVLELVKTHIPGVSEELASLAIDTVVGMWRFETENIAPRNRKSARADR